MDTSNRIPTLALVFLVLLFILSAFVPASWFGVTSQKTKEGGLISVGTIDATPKNKQTGKPLSWHEVAQQAFSDQPEILAQVQAQPIDQKTIKKLNDENNLTASFSKNLYLASIYMKENSIGDNASTQQDIMNQLIQQETDKIKPTTYAYADITVAQTETNASLKQYGNTVATITQNLLTENTITKDLQAIQNFLSTEEGGNLTQLKTDTARVNKILDQLLEVSVPKSAVIYHLSMLNQVAAYRDILQNLSTADEDPLRANIAFQKYAQTVMETTLIYKNLSEYFDMKNIAFSSKESGYVFTIGYTLK